MTPAEVLAVYERESIVPAAESAPTRKDAGVKLQRWCPNCHFFYKQAGMNYCHLADGHEGYDPTGYDRVALAWLETNQTDSSRIIPTADNCPRFVPFPKLAQVFWAEQTGHTLTDAQLHWLARGG